MNINHQKLIIIEYMPFFGGPSIFTKVSTCRQVFIEGSPDEHLMVKLPMVFPGAGDRKMGLGSKKGQISWDLVGLIYIYTVYNAVYVYTWTDQRVSCVRLLRNGEHHLLYWLHSKDLSLSWIYQRNIMKCGPFPPKTRCQSFLRRGQKALLTL